MDINAFRDFISQANQSGVVFFHTGEFSSVVVAGAAESLKHKMQESGASGPVTRKVFSTFVEMAQNIHHYAMPGNNGDAAGSILVSHQDEQFWVMCSNRMQTSHVSRLTEKLEQVRSMSLDEIKQAYKAQLKNEEHANDAISRGAGLGWLTIARDAKMPLEYSFQSDEDPQCTVFQVKAVI